MKINRLIALTLENDNIFGSKKVMHIINKCFEKLTYYVVNLYIKNVIKSLFKFYESIENKIYESIPKLRLKRIIKNITNILNLQKS